MVWKIWLYVHDFDACVYSKVDKHGCVIICLYVDDMFIFGRNLDIVNTNKSSLNTCFDRKDLGGADIIFDIKITRTKEGISLSQSHYIEKILKQFG